jgi:hypothetical protein
MERVKGIEPSSQAWEAVFGPLESLGFWKSLFLVSVLDVPADSATFPELRNECAKLCQTVVSFLTCDEDVGESREAAARSLINGH